MKKKSNPQKAKLTLVLFILLLLAGVLNLLLLLLRNDFYRGFHPAGNYLTLAANVLFVLSSMAGIAITLSNMRGKS
ncbi:hypothetical protein [Persicitalea jodogahamensis]|uniref:Uncharacterized protein n=1 Tax=Persicitalea jodogahamensis TaxID=402147 RepID=A0A8J3G8U6_9BACT|nr:hypothetical protein [Persicitalea jodogahamensis]GHB69421.1 hypothetical protein GCM10007390_23740 [Persicitalea jodogahamensis]